MMLARRNGFETMALSLETPMDKNLVDACASLFTGLDELALNERVETINAIRLELAKYSPFHTEPVDCVRWVSSDAVHANDYNPNAVAPPEMKLLEISITQDGYTQPIVTWADDDSSFEVIDGFHRHRVGKESEAVGKRIHGYLPIVVANATRADRGDRIAATIRHNRARGKHQVDAMSDIVVELKRRNWSDEKIAIELGMDPDEVLRLCQITGLAELFSDKQFSASWDVEGHIDEDDFRELSENVSEYQEEVSETRVVNTNDPARIFHTYEKWECYKAGFYNTTKDGWTTPQCEKAYRDLLRDIPRFSEILGKIIVEWKHSCEHYLTNTAMNRVAWLGQAALCYAHGIPSTFRAGFHLLTEEQQAKANDVALEYLNKWLVSKERPEISMEEANCERQSDIY